MLSRYLRKAFAVVVLIFLLILSGCTLTFTLQGAESYIIMPDGKVLDGSLNESDILMELTTKGFILKLPSALNIQIEGQIMSTSMDPTEIDTALVSIGDYLKTQLGFEGNDYDFVANTFKVTGQYTLLDFWTALGISTPGTMLGPFTIPLNMIIGQTAYEGIVDSIAHVSNTMIKDGSTIDFEFEGYLVTITEQTVGTFILWLDTVNPV